MSPTQLPTELLEIIIDNVVSTHSNLAVPASDITTRTLYSCLTVSKSTFSRSLELLYRHCLYIDSPRQLQQLLQSYQPGCVAPQLKLDSSTSMFLAPFSGDTIQEPEVIDNLHSLFDILGNYIKRMVIDMPLRSAYPDRRDGRELRVPLRNAFRRLMAMEEFTTIRDELYLSTTYPRNEVEHPVWSRWPNLKRLALYNVDISHDLLLNVGRVRALQTLVLTRADGMEDLETLRDALTPGTTIIIANVWDDHHPHQRRWLRRAMDAKPNQRVVKSDLQWSYTRDMAHAKAICVSEIDLNGGFNASHIYDCQDWMKEEALSGRLWD